jgi:hypothetical protein
LLAFGNPSFWNSRLRWFVPCLARRLASMRRRAVGLPAPLPNASNLTGQSFADDTPARRDAQTGKVITARSIT